MKRRPPVKEPAGNLPPIGRLLVPTDFSPASRHALERAALIAGVGSGSIELLHVTDPRLQPGHQKVRRALERAAQFARDGRGAGIAGARISATIRTGEPHVEIIRRAREINAEIVVMGRNRSVGALRSALGTTTARVMRMSDVPTLVVRRRPRAPYRRPLVAIEIDPSARNLIELTRRVLVATEVPLCIMHAYRVPFEDYHLAARDASSKFYFRESRKAAGESVKKLLESFGLPLSAIEVALRRGDPRVAILAQAERSHADLVALGTHGRGGIAHALLGSIAESVVANTTRDILVARPVRFTFVPP
jgi:nucleotide-binding universal stress UspA family protein